MRARVLVPAASGNLGSGFDSAGMALALYNEALVDTALEGVQVEGEGAGLLPTDERNHCVWAMQELARRCGRRLPDVGLRLTNRIPIGRGMASSGAAVISGLMLANVLFDSPCSRQDLMDLGTELEGHPDNVAAALLGGVVVSVWDGHCVEAVRLQPPEDMYAVLWVPEAELETKRARAALPEHVSMSDAVFNLSHAALFAAAFAVGQWEHLRTGARDRLHQPYRAPMVKGLNEMLDASVQSGALASWLSGAGPCVLALCKGDTAYVERCMYEVGIKHAGKGRILKLRPDLLGAQIACV
ncbi:MAG: homoserine kinase [Chloroflexota bacterium]|nr:homoserine kinase [Chloroflexota bacterium]